MAGRIARSVADSLRGIGAAVRARPGTFLGVAGAVSVLSIVLPPLVLSVVRKPVDYFTFNPWLKRLPEYLASDVPVGVKLEKLPALALFWFSSDNPYGTEWGFAVDVTDLLRILATSLLFGAYFALWRAARGPGGSQRPRLVVRRQGGVAGAFVSLHKQGLLRGCIGYVHALHPLYRTVMEAAAAAALHDPRFPPVRPAELPDVHLEISVLSPFRTVRAEEIQVGAHGLLIAQERKQGLLLPQVAVEHQWDRERFLEETCRKAGLAPDAWRRGATIEAFTAEVFGEEYSTAEVPHRLTSR